MVCFDSRKEPTNLNAEISKIAGINPELLRRPVEIRSKVADEAEIIHSISSMLT